VPQNINTPIFIFQEKLNSIENNEFEEFFDRNLNNQVEQDNNVKKFSVYEIMKDSNFHEKYSQKTASINFR
jgi:hypothetical protein